MFDKDDTMRVRFEAESPEYRQRRLADERAAIEALLARIDIEALSSIEHEQWVQWSTAVFEKVDPETRDRWRRFQVTYEDLPEAAKEMDRYWARIVVESLKVMLDPEAQVQ